MAKQGLFKPLVNKDVFLNKAKLRINEVSHALAYSLLLSHITFIPYVHATPTGGNVVGGSGSINHAGLITTINQTTGSMAINWDSYNLHSNERVIYNQPTALSISLNRILDNNGTQIHGRIDANGRVILVNRNGIFFGASARVDSGELINASLGR